MGWTDYTPLGAAWNYLDDKLGPKKGDPANATYTDADYLRNQAQQGIAGAQGRQAPQAANTKVGQVRTGTGATINQAPQGQFRNAQQGLLAQLGGVASGQQAGAGEMAVNRQVGQGLAAQQAIARSMRGGNAAMASRGAARNAGEMAVAGAGQAQQAAMQDQTAARGLMSQLAGQGREQDIGLAAQQAGMNQQMNLANLSSQNQAIFQQAGLNQATSLANMQAKLQQAGMNDQAALGYLAQLYGMNQAEMMARLQQEQALLSQPSTFGQVLQAAGPIATMVSDERVKERVEDVSADVDEMLAHLEPVAWDYSDRKHGEGRHVGVMAQALESSPIGALAVFEDGDGVKHLAKDKVIGLLLASVARLAARVEHLESVSAEPKEG